MTPSKFLLAACCSVASLSAGLAASSAAAAPVITTVGADLSAGSYTFNVNGSSFTFGFNGDYFGGGPLTFSSAAGGQINTVFGSPTTFFVDRGPVTFGPTDQYAAFANPTAIRFSNNSNFIGLRAVTSTGDAFYGFAYTTNNILNSFGFETVANRAITATTATAAVPEPATWGLMILGFGMIGAASRSRKVKTAVKFA
jgi:hypothetical protein